MEMVLKFDKRDIEPDSGIYKALSNAVDGCVVSINGFETLLKVAHTEVKPSNSCYSWNGQDYQDYGYTVTLVSMRKAKSKQEVDAEAAVEKAKESLRAAEVVLESLKGV